MLGELFLIFAFVVLIGFFLSCMMAWNDIEKYNQAEIEFYQKCFQKERSED